MPKLTTKLFNSITVNKTYRFNIKHFNDIQLGDIVSSYKDLQLYKITNIKKNQNLTIIENNKYSYAEGIEWNFNTNNFINSQPDKLYYYDIIDRPTCLIVDNIKNNKYKHIFMNDLKPNNIIFNHKNNKYYKFIGCNIIQEVKLIQDKFVPIYDNIILNKYYQIIDSFFVIDI